MNETDFLAKYVDGFKGVFHVFDARRGYIVWRRGTGGNFEILHLRAFQLRRGYATSLIRQMLEQLKHNPPYFSIFVFMLGENKNAQGAYEALGFKLQRVRGLYKTDDAFIGTASYEVLCERYEI